MRTRPLWDDLFRVAAAQAGCFTTRQAAASGYSDQALQKHLRAARVQRVRHGIYRLTHFPVVEHEELAILWLWSEQRGVFSHESALSLHGLSDLLPSRMHLTVPTAWLHRRQRLPPDVQLHHADLANHDCEWFGPVRITTAARSLNDCARAGLTPDLLRQAALQAIDRGIVTVAAIEDVEQALRPFGGLAA